jgi:hypothetical protein
MVTPHKSLIARQYPLSRGDLPLQLSLMSPEKHDSHYVSRPPGSKISVIFPLKVSGLSKAFILELNGMAVTLDNSSGLHWDPGWHSQRQNVFPDAATLAVGFEIEPDIFDQLKSAPANMHLLLAFTLYHDQNQRQFVVPSNEFNLDGVGLCSTWMQYSNSINCRAALRRPSFLLVASETAASTCPLNEDQTPPPPGRLARGLIRGGDSAAEMGVSPIRKFEIFVSDWDRPIAALRVRESVPELHWCSVIPRSTFADVLSCSTTTCQSTSTH